MLLQKGLKNFRGQLQVGFLLPAFNPLGLRL
jgi:hypothetical protein